MSISALQEHLRDGPSQTRQHGRSHDQHKANQIELCLACHQHDQPCADDSHDASQIPARPAFQVKTLNQAFAKRKHEMPSIDRQAQPWKIAFCFQLQDCRVTLETCQQGRKSKDGQQQSLSYCVHTLLGLAGQLVGCRRRMQLTECKRTLRSSVNVGLQRNVSKSKLSSAG